MAVVLAAFVAGLVVGVAGDRVYLIHQGRIFPSRSAAKSMTKRLIDRLDRELHFDAQQRARVETIVEGHRQRIDALWSSVRPAVGKEINATNAEIEKILTPEQLPKFKALQLRMHNRTHRGSTGMPPGPPPDR
jgi:hypothetical protein